METDKIGSIVAQFVDKEIRKALSEKGFDPDNKQFLKEHLQRICFTYNRKEYFFIRTVFICGFDFANLFI